MCLNKTQFFHWIPKEIYSTNFHCDFYGFTDICNEEGLCYKEHSISHDKSPFGLPLTKNNFSCHHQCLLDLPAYKIHLSVRNLRTSQALKFNSYPNLSKHHLKKVIFPSKRILILVTKMTLPCFLF